eukprot:5624203-Amphidinium_carterae.1
MNAYLIESLSWNDSPCVERPSLWKVACTILFLVPQDLASYMQEEHEGLCKPLRLVVHWMAWHRVFQTVLFGSSTSVKRRKHHQ